jgi:undecaprenyl-diphosphatase
MAISGRRGDRALLTLASKGWKRGGGVINSLQSLALGILQGLGEFLPISSSAHLILAPSYLHWPDPGLAFDVALHLGTLLALIIYYWKDIVLFCRAVIEPSNESLASERKLLYLVILATIPGAIAGVLLEHKAETVFRSPSLIAWALIAMGALLGLADHFSKGNKQAANLTWGMAMGIGVAQAFALIPGVSRSGITITMGLFLGLERKEAARFSFLMSMPIIAGAGMLKFKEIFLSPDKGVLGVGFAAAAISGLFAIWALMRYVQNHRYTPFVLYRWILGTLVLLNLSRFS